MFIKLAELCFGATGVVKEIPIHTKGAHFWRIHEMLGMRGIVKNGVNMTQKGRSVVSSWKKKDQTECLTLRSSQQCDKNPLFGWILL